MLNKFKNPYFILGLISTIFLAANIDFNTLTSWQLLLNAILGILNNPVAIVAVIGAVLGLVNDNSTPGFGDAKDDTKRLDE